MKRRRQVPPHNQSQQEPTTGSPSEGEPVFLAAGRLRRAHGLGGEMVMDILTDYPERLTPGRKVYIGEAHEPVEIASTRGHHRALIIRLQGIDTPEATAKYRNALLYVKANELPKLPDGEYYYHQLLGMAVFDEAGQELGTLTDILETGANDVYVVKSADGKELLLPAIAAVILAVDPDQRQMRVRPPEWL